MSQRVGRAVDGQQAQAGRGTQVGVVGQRAHQLGEDGHQVIVQALAGRALTHHQVAPRTGQRAPGLHRRVGDRAGPRPARQQPARQGARIDPIGLGTPPQTGGPRGGLVGTRQRDAIALLNQPVIEGLPQAAGGFQPDQQGGRLAPCAQPAHPVSRARRTGGDGRAREAHRATGGLQSAHDTGCLGDVNADHTANLRRQQGTSPLVAHGHTRWQAPDLPGAVPLRMGARGVLGSPGRSCSTIDRALTGSRYGSLSESVEPTGGTKTVPCQVLGQLPHRTYCPLPSI